MKSSLSTCLLFVLLVAAGNAQALWGTPYGTYWPNAWPGQNVRPGFYPNDVRHWGYSGPDWSMRGYMTKWGDMNVVIEYHGNVNNDFFGGGRWYPGYGAYRQPPYYGYGWR